MVNSTLHSISLTWLGGLLGLLTLCTPVHCSPMFPFPMDGSGILNPFPSDDLTDLDSTSSTVFGRLSKPLTLSSSEGYGLPSWQSHRPSADSLLGSSPVSPFLGFEGGFDGGGRGGGGGVSSSKGIPSSFVERQCSVFSFPAGCSTFVSSAGQREMPPPIGDQGFYPNSTNAIFFPWTDIAQESWTDLHRRSLVIIHSFKNLMYCTQVLKLRKKSEYSGHLTWQVLPIMDAVTGKSTSRSPVKAVLYSFPRNYSNPHADPPQPSGRVKRVDIWDLPASKGEFKLKRVRVDFQVCFAHELAPSYADVLNHGPVRVQLNFRSKFSAFEFPDSIVNL